MENIEDEIEFFGFLPVTFTTDLQESLEDTLREILQRNDIKSSKLRASFFDSLKKNIFIFNNFVLRNILKFPPGFKIERRITDLKIHGDASKLVRAIEDAHNNAMKLNEERACLREKMHELMCRNSAYKNLLRDHDKHMELSEAAREVRKYLKEVTAVYEQFKISACAKESNFDSLMEYKDIKSDYYRE
ncbi:hypothetical protein PAEPH01_2346, partial [Pancytospora epiphaga]